jgi:hypothetical protein
MTITNAHLNDSINQLVTRVGKLENRVDKSDGALDEMKDKLDALVAEFKAARIVIGVVGAIVTPIVTALIVLIMQHVWK